MEKQRKWNKGKEKNREKQGDGFFNFISSVTYKIDIWVKMHREVTLLQSFFFKADFVLR